MCLFLWSSDKVGGPLVLFYHPNSNHIHSKCSFFFILNRNLMLKRVVCFSLYIFSLSCFVGRSIFSFAEYMILALIQYSDEAAKEKTDWIKCAVCNIDNLPIFHEPHSLSLFLLCPLLTIFWLRALKPISIGYWLLNIGHIMCRWLRCCA